MYDEINSTQDTRNDDVERGRPALLVVRVRLRGAVTAAA